MGDPEASTHYDELLRNPDHFLLAFDGDAAVFASMDRGAYGRSIFLDPARIAARSPHVVRVPYGPLVQKLTDDGGGTSEISYIFHVAHCGSTLLARALDLADETLVLREPRALRQLGVEAGRSYFDAAPDADWQARMTLATALLARRYRHDAPVLVKGNVPVNFMLPQLEATPIGPSIVLYSSLEDYLVAVLRTPKLRNWAQRVTAEVPAAIETLTGKSSWGSDVECVALLWIAQIKLYHQLTSSRACVASLDAEDLFNRPADVVRAAFAHIGKPQSETVVAQIIASDLFSHSAKNPSIAFSNADRLNRAARARAELAAELRAARAFVERLPAAQDLPHHLANDLGGSEVPLLGSR